MKMKLIIATIVLTVAVVLLVLTPNPETLPRVETTSQVEVLLPTGLAIMADVADSEAEREQGLSDREALGVTEGLLFVWNEPSSSGIWMKDMNFPIDIIWLLNGEVVHIVENAQPDDSENREVYTPDSLADAVLEVSAGIAESQNIEVGSQLEFIGL